MRTRNLLLLLTILTVIAGCTIPDAPVQKHSRSESSVDSPGDVSAPADWKGSTLTDVLSGEEFTIMALDGQHVLLESFAVWCPTCTKQQREMGKLTDVGITHISLNTDPNEDAAKVRSYARDQGFDWHFVVSSPQFTQQLVDEFGTGVITAPQAPVILVCPDHSSRFLPRGLKTADELRGYIAEGC